MSLPEPPEGCRVVVIRKRVEENFIHSGFKSIRVATELEEVVFMKGDIPVLEGKEIVAFSDTLRKRATKLVKRDLAVIEEQVLKMLEKGEGRPSK